MARPLVYTAPPARPEWRGGGGQARMATDTYAQHLSVIVSRRLRGSLKPRGAMPLACRPHAKAYY